MATRKNARAQKRRRRKKLLQKFAIAFFVDAETVLANLRKNYKVYFAGLRNKGIVARQLSTLESYFICEIENMF